MIAIGLPIEVNTCKIATNLPESSQLFNAQMRCVLINLDSKEFLLREGGR